MKHKSVLGFSEELASKDGKYGGGSAASVVGAFASSLAQFVFELQQGKEKYKDDAERIQSAINHSTRLTEELLELAEEDADAFNPVMELFKLPKDTEEERAFRQEKIDQGLLEAAKPPMDMLEKLHEVIDLFELLLFLEVRGTIVDDIAVGLLFTEATIESAKINCMVNIKSIKNETLRDEMTADVEAIYASAIERVRIFKEQAMGLIK